MNNRLGYVADFCPVCVELRTCALERLQDGDSSEHQRVCVSCKIAVRADPAQYASIAPAPGPVAQLQAATFPDLEQVHHARRALEAQVNAAPHSIDPALRHQLLMEPLTLLAAHVAPFGTTLERSYLDLTVLPLLRRCLARLEPGREEVEKALDELRARGDMLATMITASDVLAQPAPDNVYPQTAAASATKARGGPEQAAMLFRASGWLGLLAIAAAVLMEAMVDTLGTTLRSGFVLALLVIFIAGTVLCFRLPVALERREGWSRAAGLAMAFLFVWIFPIGTAAGGFIAYCLIMRWHDPATREPALRM